MVLIGSVKSLITCPICMDRIKGAFITKCGHSFCFSCISQHANGQSTLCPVCRTTLEDGDIFPNYALEELSRSAEANAAKITSVESQSQPQGSIFFIKQKIAELMEQKSILENDSSGMETENLLQFLYKLYDRKKKQDLKIFDDVAAELIQIERDIKLVRQQLTISENLSSSSSFSASEEGDSVPSMSLQDDLVPAAKRLQTDDMSMIIPTTRRSPSDESRNAKLEAFFPDIEGIYFECKKNEGPEPLAKFGKKLHQVTGQNVFREVSSFILPESLNTSNIISSIEFDTRGQMVASGGVAKRIKIFNVDQMESTGWSCTFPIQEVHVRAKISAIAWNPYIQQQLASVDYEGLLNIYDAVTGQVVSRYEEHDRRVWSLDYCKTDPTRMATGSDDHRVKIWSINNRHSVCTIDAKANICSVQFSPASPNLIAFGSADHNIHLHDLRFPSKSLGVMQGHKKAVSYVRFLAENEIVSASTDCTLRLWKLPSAQDPASSIVSSECYRTYTGHLNEKNFVGFAVNGDLISCGSESNIVYTYHRDLSRSISSFRFTSICPHSGVEIESETPAFISALSWKQNSNRLVAANSLGVIKFLELIS